MDSFVFTRHSSDCKFKRDRFCNRCNCPKWVEGRFNHERFRKSASSPQVRDQTTIRRMPHAPPENKRGGG